MDSESPEQMQSASAMLAQAKQESTANGELIRLILAGTRRIDSWLIEQRIVPRLQRENATLVHLTLTTHDKERLTAILLPLPDGAAFARSTTERWSVLERLEALSAIQYIGYRYASEDRWSPEIEAVVQRGDEPPSRATPFEVARIWAEITGLKPAGFESGTLDEMEALGLKLIGRIFNSQGRLGL